MIVSIILLIIVAILNVVDYVQTFYAIQSFGVGIEANPIGRFLFEHNCAYMTKLILVPIALVIIGCIIRSDKRFSWTAYFLVIFYLGVIINNFIVLFRMGLL